MRVLIPPLKATIDCLKLNVEQESVWITSCPTIRSTTKR